MPTRAGHLPGAVEPTATHVASALTPAPPISKFLRESDPVLSHGDDIAAEHPAFNGRLTSRDARARLKRDEAAAIRREAHARRYSPPTRSTVIAPWPLPEPAQGYPLHANVVAARAFYAEHGPECLPGIDHGQRLQFSEPMPRIYVPPYNEAPARQEFLVSEVRKLMRNRVVAETNGPPHFCGAVFTVDKVDEHGNVTFRFTYDATILNAFLTYKGYPMEDISVTLALLRAGDLIVTADASGAYFHNWMHPDDVKFLGFSLVDDQGVTRFFTFLCPPFGLGPSGLYWWRLFFVSIRRLRALGHRVTFFGDDMLGAAAAAAARRLSTDAQSTLRDAGITTNAKSRWEPSPQQVHIGYYIDLDTWLLHIRSRRIRKTIASAHDFIDGAWTRRRAMRLALRLVSMSVVLGATAFLYTRRLFAVGDGKRLDATDPDPNRDEVSSDIRYLIHVLEKNPSRRISGEIRRFDFVISSDASATGIGGVDERGGVSARALTSLERTASSGQREACGISFNVRVRGHTLNGLSVVILCDNKACSSALRFGSRVPDLHNVSVGLDKYCRWHDIQLSVVWAPRTILPIELSDAVSRFNALDTHDWHISDRTYAEICRRARVTPDLDCFADEANTRCERFVSRFPCGGVTVDALTAPLAELGSTLYACPPPTVALQFLSRLPLRAPILVVLPRWPKAVWFPHVCSPNFRPRRGVTIVHAFCADGAVVAGPNGTPPFLEPRMRAHFFVAMFQAKLD